MDRLHPNNKAALLPELVRIKPQSQTAASCFVRLASNQGNYHIVLQSI